VDGKTGDFDFSYYDSETPGDWVIQLELCFPRRSAIFESCYDCFWELLSNLLTKGLRGIGNKLGERPVPGISGSILISACSKSSQIMILNPLTMITLYNKKSCAKCILAKKSWAVVITGRDRWLETELSLIHSYINAFHVYLWRSATYEDNKIRPGPTTCSFFKYENSENFNT